MDPPVVASDLPPLTYLTADSMAEGVGASQVLPYVEALSQRGMAVTLHSFERTRPAPAVAARLDAAGVRWVAHPWGRGGATGGVARMFRGAPWLRRAELVHARSDIPAGSALLARCPGWVWDMRGFWADERIALGLLRSGSASERLVRGIERASARRAGAVVTLTAAAIEVLVSRYGPQIGEKTNVVTTCVDVNRFAVSAMPPGRPLRILLAGTLNRRYDVPLMLRLAEALRRRRATELEALVPELSFWDADLRASGVTPRAASSADMPARVSASHVGLSVLQADEGVSLRASMPTKIGELLAAGRPVVVNAGLGDLDDLLAAHDCGVVVADASEGAVLRAVGEIGRLVDDPATPGRCRALAEDHFDLRRGVDALLDVYRLAAGY